MNRNGPLVGDEPSLGVINPARNQPRGESEQTPLSQRWTGMTLVKETHDTVWPSQPSSLHIARQLFGSYSQCGGRSVQEMTYRPTAR